MPEHQTKCQIVDQLQPPAEEQRKGQRNALHKIVEIVGAMSNGTMRARRVTPAAERSLDLTIAMVNEARRGLSM